MRLPFTLWLVAATGLVGLTAKGAAEAAPAGVRSGYLAPSVTVPFSVRPPKIDGVIEPEEWRLAASLTALQTTKRDVSARQATFWMTWDEDHLYVAMRSPTRPGERLVQAFRTRGRDVNVVFDDSFEIWLDLATRSPDGQPVYFQFLCNFAGVRLDAMHEPAVGNMRLNWESGWEPRSRIAPDGAWEMEVAIPRASVFKAQPLTDGLEFRGLLARNFKRPWEQCSVEGSGTFSVRDTYTRFRLGKSVPAVALRSVGNVRSNAFGLDLSVLSPRRETLRWSFANDAGLRREGELNCVAGEPCRLGDMQVLAKAGKGSYRLRLTSADGSQTWLDWCANQAFGGPASVAEAPLNDPGDVVDFKLNFNSVHDYVRLTADFIQYDARSKIVKGRLLVRDAAGKAFTRQEVAMDAAAYMNGLMWVTNLPPGSYVALLECLDRSGGVLLTRESPFTKQDLAKAYSWWNTPLGNIEKVIAPWTPVVVTNGVLSVWGRTMRPGAAGLPSQITSQGKPLLAAPARMEAEFDDGRRLQAEGGDFEITSNLAHRVVGMVRSALGDLELKSTVSVEFDGLYHVDLQLTPRRTASLRSLKLVVPLRADLAETLYGKGTGVRSGMDLVEIPTKEKGRLWDSRRVDSQPMTTGTFIPYVWVGSPEAGLCWFADSDEGWVPGGREPAIELRRDQAGQVDLVFNLISEPFKLTAPRRIAFAFQASPVKPLHRGWRMDSWWCDDTFRDFADVGARGGSRIFTSLPFTLNPAATRQVVAQRRASNTSYNLGLAKYQANAVPYYEHINIGSMFIPEWKDFEDEWRTSVSRGLYYGNTFTDFMIHHLGTWARDCGIDGLYSDNVHPLACDRIEAGRGYRLPDGRIQPTYAMFSTRRYFLRMRAAFAEQGKTNKIIFHATNNLLLPWAGAADMFVDGEHHVIYPEMNKDFMDFWSRERLRLINPEGSGVAANFLQEYQGNWDVNRRKQAMRAFTGALILHDILPSANCNGMNREAFLGRDRFGIEAEDVRFRPYWQRGSGLKSSTPEVFVSGWQRPGRVLLAVVNYGEAATAAVQLDTTPLKLPPADGCKAWDAETQQPLTLDGQGKLEVQVGRHDYRQIIVQAR